MKRFASIALAVMLLLTLCACGGDVSAVKITAVPSEYFTESEINDAIQVIITEFRFSWSGCTLTEISYAGDDVNAREAQYYLEQHYADYSAVWGEYDQMLILTSSFDVDQSGGDGSFNPNSTYTGWKWLLVKSGNGPWRHVDHGYG